jgi:hypothetical protein
MKNHFGMRLKADNNRPAFFLPRLFHHPFENMPVTKVNPVKIANGCENVLKLGGYVFTAANNVHINQYASFQVAVQ